MDFEAERIQKYLELFLDVFDTVRHDEEEMKSDRAESFNHDVVSWVANKEDYRLSKYLAPTTYSILHDEQQQKFLRNWQDNQE